MSDMHIYRLTKPETLLEDDDSDVLLFVPTPRTGCIPSGWDTRSARRSPWMEYVLYSIIYSTCFPVQWWKSLSLAEERDTMRMQRRLVGTPFFRTAGRCVTSC